MQKLKTRRKNIASIALSNKNKLHFLLSSMNDTFLTYASHFSIPGKTRRTLT